MEESNNVEVHYVVSVEEKIVSVGGENCEKVPHEKLRKYYNFYEERYKSEGFKVFFDDLDELYRIAKVFHETAQSMVELGVTKYSPNIRLDFESGEILQEELITLSTPFPGHYDENGDVLRYTMVDVNKFMKIISFFKDLEITSLRVKFDKEDPEKPILFESFDSVKVQALLMPVRINLKFYAAIRESLQEDIENEKQPAGVGAGQTAEKELIEA